MWREHMRDTMNIDERVSPTEGIRSHRKAEENPSLYSTENIFVKRTLRIPPCREGEHTVHLLLGQNATIAQVIGMQSPGHRESRFSTFKFSALKENPPEFVVRFPGFWSLCDPFFGALKFLFHRL